MINLTLIFLIVWAALFILGAVLVITELRPHSRPSVIRSILTPESPKPQKREEKMVAPRKCRADVNIKILVKRDTGEKYIWIYDDAHRDDFWASTWKMARCPDLSLTSSDAAHLLMSRPAKVVHCSRPRNAR